MRKWGMKLSDLTEKQKRKYSQIYDTCQAAYMTDQASHDYAMEIVERDEKRNQTRRERDQALRDNALVKVRGALGGTDWE